MRGCWGRVLIETLWNVNEDPEGLSDFVVSFNRNIVECKYASEQAAGISESKF